MLLLKDYYDFRMVIFNIREFKGSVKYVVIFSYLGFLNIMEFCLIGFVVNYCNFFYYVELLFRLNFLNIKDILIMYVFFCSWFFLEILSDSYNFDNLKK